MKRTLFMVSTYFIVLLLTLLNLISCSGSSLYIREDQVTKTMSFNDTDLKLLAEKMVVSLLESAILPTKSIIWVSDIQNNTSEYIDTQGILDKISVSLLKSGRFRLVERQALSKLAQEKMIVDFRRIDVQDAVKIGQVIGADYVLLGNLMSIEHKAKGFLNEDKLVYYKFTMRLIGMDSEIIWMDEKELKKVNY